MTAVDIPNDTYHQHPALSSSGARKLLPPSCPALFKWEQDHPTYKRIFDFGSAAHKMVLGDPLAELVIVDADNWRRKADQTTRDQARGDGLLPILRCDFNEIEAMAAAIRAHPIARQLLNPDSGKPEQSLFWTDAPTGVELRARFDWLPYPVDGRRMIIPDYKTTGYADTGRFVKSAMNLGYHQQHAWYCDAIIASGLDPDPALVFIVQERDAPYLVNVIQLDSRAEQIGRHLNQQAIDVFKTCTETGEWPGYSTGVEQAGLPTYYTNQFQEIL
jgi:PDDEXK-like domain of unknown function (DUF3799)